MNNLKQINNLNDSIERYGRLKIIGDAPSKKYGRTIRRIVICECDCGNIKNISLNSLKSGLTKSCGCLSVELTKKRSTKHGLTINKGGNNKDRRMYRLWHSMIQRCNVKRNKSFPNYGGRGIYVCDRWKNSVTNFIEDMGYKPRGKSLDRINNDGPYSPENCRWATASQQVNNQRKRKDAVSITHKGVTMGIKEWSNKLGINYITLYNRIYTLKMPLEKALVPRLLK